MNILFMCVANSARSQIAEGLAKRVFGERIQIQSAGSVPGKLNPLAVQAMDEIGIDISKHFSKSIDQLPSDFLANLDYVITLCAEEVCPILVSEANKLHWPLPDPAGHDGLSNDKKLELFRHTRDAIKEKLFSFKSELKL
jgi:arsenate reductase (thioredoxin)